MIIDIIDKKKIECMFVEFYFIMFINEFSYEDKIVEILCFGVEYMEFLFGIISYVIDDYYLVIYVYFFNGEFKLGIFFFFMDIYCILIFEVDGLLVMMNVVNLEFVKYLCYEIFFFEIYIGVLFFFDGQIYGIINFMVVELRNCLFMVVDLQIIW